METATVAKKEHSADVLFNAAVALGDMCKAYQEAGGGGPLTRMDPVTYMQNLTTVQVGGPRRSGHTGAAIRVARHYDGLLIVPSAAAAERVREMDGGDDLFVLTRMQAIGSSVLPGRGLSTVVIDDARQGYTVSDMEIIYGSLRPALAATDTPLIILLG